MKLRKAMAVALTGALVLTTFATGTTSEAAKKTKLKTKKVSIFVKGKKKISITGKKAKHKYTFTSKKKKIAKVSKTGVITGVKAGKTTITVKDTWKQKGKKKSKKLGTINVTVKKKTTPKPKVTANVPQVTQQPPAPATQDPNGGGSQPPVQTPNNSGNQPDDPTPTPTPPGNPDDPTPTPTPPGNPGDQTPTPTPPGNPDIKEPTAVMTLAKHAIREGSATTAEVSVSAGEVKDVTWSVEKANVAEAAKDAEDAKKAVITGKAVGETKITAEVKVTVEGKDFTVKAKQELTVAAKDTLVVNASIESAPTEMTVDDAVELKVAADVGTIESVVWAVEGEAATVETDATDVAKAVLKVVKPGVVTVSATVTVRKDGKTATDTAKVTINVNLSDIIEIDITKNIAVATWGKPAQYEVQEDGTVKITWTEDSDNYAFVRWNFEAMDLTNYWCVIDAEGTNATVELPDATRTEPAWGNAVSVIPPKYGSSFPFKLQLSEENKNSDMLPDQAGTLKPVEGGVDFTTVAGVSLAKGTQKEELTLIVKSITFYKYEEDIPKA